MDKKTVRETTEIRRLAEERLMSRALKPASDMPEADTQRLLHELQVHQIELEMQNEELQRAWREVDNGREKYTDLFDFAPVGYLLLDHLGYILQTNLTGARMIGGHRADLVGRRLSLFVVESQRLELKNFIEKVFATRMRQACELTLSHEHNGSAPLNVHVGGSPSADGQECRIVLTDITERVNAQEALRQLTAQLEQRVVERTAQLVAANKEMEAFSYSISHDLKAPLRAIDGFSIILLEDYAANLPPEAQKYLNRVCANVVKMRQMVDGLLSLARLGRNDFEPKMQATTAVVRRALEELKAETADREIEIVVNPLPNCTADAVLLRQVFANLLANAIKFTSKTPNARIEVGATEDKGQVVFYVRDNGAGFNMHYADKLFGAFQRLHSEDEFAGTGIGLTIVQRIIHRHGGRVWAEGEVNHGATFYFTLGDAK